MIVVIAPETDIENETEILNSLFEAGLNAFHLRKPEKSKREIDVYLNRIDQRFHGRIILHHFHEISYDFKVKGIHLQEQVRLNLGSELDPYVAAFKAKGLTVSSSFHEVHELESCATDFDYHLLSPVFSSISKEGYAGRGFDVTNSQKKIIGMGGVNEATIPALKQLGFAGIGVLGGIWNDPDPLHAFLKIQEKYASND